MGFPASQDKNGPYKAGMWWAWASSCYLTKIVMNLTLTKIVMNLTRLGCGGHELLHAIWQKLSWILQIMLKIPRIRI